jgi:predicted nucleotide-binding protein
MAILTRDDKIARLRRTIAKIDGLKPNLLNTIVLGGKELSEQSSAFQEWHKYAIATINLVFGEHSHYAEDFNEISYNNYLSNILGDERQRKEAYLQGLDKAKELFQSMMKEIQSQAEGKAIPIAGTPSLTIANNQPCIFIGHGRSALWARLQVFLEKELGLRTIAYESESRVGESIVAILEQMLREASFAVLVLTAEDETAFGSKRARQNVVHEAGLLQGRLGFNKAILLVQEGLEEFSNVAGLQYIPFSGDRIDQTFYELQRVLKREGLLN